MSSPRRILLKGTLAGTSLALVSPRMRGAPGMWSERLMPWMFLASGKQKLC